MVIKYMIFQSHLNNNWRMEFIDNLDSIESVLILENNIVRDNISLKTQEDKEIFKKNEF